MTRFSTYQFGKRDNRHCQRVKYVNFFLFCTGVIHPKVLAMMSGYPIISKVRYRAYMHRLFYQGHVLLRWNQWRGALRNGGPDSQSFYTAPELEHLVPQHELIRLTVISRVIPVDICPLLPLYCCVSFWWSNSASLSLYSSLDPMVKCSWSYNFESLVIISSCKYR